MNLLTGIAGINCPVLLSELSLSRARGLAGRSSDHAATTSSSLRTLSPFQAAPVGDGPDSSRRGVLTDPVGKGTASGSHTVEVSRRFTLHTDSIGHS